jgi:transposase
VKSVPAKREEQGVECAPAPARIIEKALASDRVVIDTVVSKYADYVPLYRQSAILERETGIELSRATLDGWVMRVGELLRPITATMGQELLSGSYIQADETTVGVQMHDGRAKITRLTSGNTAIRSDRWSLTSGLAGNEKVPDGSWATSRAYSRATVTALTIISVAQRSCALRAGRMPDESSSMRSNSIPKIPTSIQIVAQMDELFAIGAQARQEALSQSDRHVLRLEKSKPLLEQIKTSIQRARIGALPKSCSSQGM